MVGPIPHTVNPLARAFAGSVIVTGCRNVVVSLGGIVVGASTRRSIER